MRDAGVPSRREKSKAANMLAKTVQDQMQSWADDNFQHFTETMELIRTGAPVQWVKLYMEAVKLGLDKTTNINININRQQDRENLQALVRTRIPTGIPDKGSYTPYEEIKEKERVVVTQQTET